jgi:SAM-dependent methyltransferase
MTDAGDREVASGSWQRLVLLSCLMLFLELALIRFVSAHVVYVRYFTNFVLLASFLGIGLGFLRSTKGRDLFLSLPLLLLLTITFVVLFPVEQLHGSTRGLFGLPALPDWVTLPIVFVLVTIVMMASAAGVARVFGTFPPLDAYRLDILGSILGIVLFTVASILRLPPVAWVSVVTLLFALGAVRRASLRHWAALGTAVTLLGLQSLISADTWSPYYRVSVEARQDDGRLPIRVNGFPHQSIWRLDDLLRRQPFYGYPYRHLTDRSPQDVLIVGAGSGNDVALALSRGARRVDAVEIDPVLLALGEDLHPHRPYQDPRVRGHAEDGRAFLEGTDRRYDLVLFALPDSLVLVARQGSLRLESFLFTREAFESVKDHLTPDGTFSMYNYYRPDVFDRYAATLTEVFGAPPCLDKGERGAGANFQAVLTVSAEPGAMRCSRWEEPQRTPRSATDDYPFPYAQGWGLSNYYVVSLTLLLLGSALAIRRFGGIDMAGARRYADLFFMGAAFLLLETKSIVQFALLFGTTWLVNSLVFAGILVSVLLAIEIAARFPRLDRRMLYGLLLASLGVAWFVRTEQLLGLSPITRFLVATAVTFAPIFFANLIFADRFRAVGSSTTAFGLNLLGAILGGVIEYSSVVVGYRALTLVAAVIYSIAYALTPRRAPSAAGQAGAGATEAAAS